MWESFHTFWHNVLSIEVLGIRIAVEDYSFLSRERNKKITATPTLVSVKLDCTTTTNLITVDLSNTQTQS